MFLSKKSNHITFLSLLDNVVFSLVVVLNPLCISGLGPLSL